MLNIAGPEYDFAHVLYAVLHECEHRRRSMAAETLEEELGAAAREKLQEIKAAYDEFGGSAAYWESLHREVIETALPQYADEAARMNALEQNGFNVFRNGDLAARLLFAVCGLLIGSIIIALPFIPIFEDVFAFALTAGGFIYPDLVRYMHERRHAQFLNGLIADAARYQQNARLHYVTTKEIRDSFLPASEEPRQLQ